VHSGIRFTEANMADPNVQAAKGDHTGQEEANACADMGLIAIATSSTHPGIIGRWNIEHVHAPGKVMHRTGGGTTWRTSIWTHAWVYALFRLNDAMDVFTNAWTSVQENKPRMVQLKRLYDEALASPERQLILLTEFQLGWVALDERVERGITAAVRLTHKELDK
jgi:hypothetical protein